MPRMRNVKLEFLRHGSAHNQLLSPLTEYLALCGNYAAASVRVPFEHHQWMRRLQHLRSQVGDPENTEVKDTAQLLSRVLGSVPGLVAELSADSSVEPLMTHLRLVLSASELALLPFELADAPDGCPGAGQPLSLQTRSPICMTREVRRSNPQWLEWPRASRILFVAAAPPGVGGIPFEENYKALRESLEYWIDDTEAHGVSDSTHTSLHVLGDATPTDIHDACAKWEFTHVHIWPTVTNCQTRTVASASPCTLRTTDRGRITWMESG